MLRFHEEKGSLLLRITLKQNQGQIMDLALAQGQVRVRRGHADLAKPVATQSGTSGIKNDSFYCGIGVRNPMLQKKTKTK